jgi:hypothetical protein
MATKESLIFFAKSEGSWFGLDKFGHLCLHLLIMILFTKFAEPLVVFVWSQLFGIWYEIVIDCHLTKDGFSIMDIMYNFIGATIGFYFVVTIFYSLYYVL